MGSNAPVQIGYLTRWGNQEYTNCILCKRVRQPQKGHHGYDTKQDSNGETPVLELQYRRTSFSCISQIDLFDIMKYLHV